MRLIERIARLEKAQGTDDSMTVDEIDTAAARYQAELAPKPEGASIVGMAGWRRAIEAARPSWFQRTLAAMTPIDWVL